MATAHENRREITTGAAAGVGTGPCSRRALLAGIPGLVVLPGALSACSGTMTEREPQSTAQSTTQVPETSIPTSEVPVGGATIVDASGAAVVVAQPTDGDFVAYSAVCTHQGARVKVVGDMSLRCPLHGSQFDAATGAVTNPPAARPLDEVAIRVDGDKLVIGA